MNEKIRAREIRVIGDDGEQFGILSVNEALALATEKNLDLVEISPNATPPVCKIMDYGKFKYEKTKKEKENIDIKNIDTDFLMVPLYQSISAGYGASNVDFIEMIPVFGLKKNGTTYFAVKVKGDSMEPKIPNGSTIIIKKDIAIEVGEIGAFNLNDENFVKQKKLIKDKLILHSFNLAYEDKVVNEFDDFKEYGKVVKVMIDL